MPDQMKLLLARYSYFALSLLLARAVFYGFSGTVEANLLHPSFPRPAVLYVHAAVFGGWMMLLVFQSGLVALARKPRWHKWLGWLGVAMGCAMPVLGTASAIRMTHLRAALGDTDDIAFLILAFNDMAAFTVLFALAVLLRKTPEAHRRLMLMATCVISVAGLTRFPPWLPNNEQGTWAYAYIDAVIGLAMARDWIVQRRIHPAYAWGLPAAMLGQAIGITIYMTRPEPWMAVARAIVR
jgi:hypothetical protein